MQEKRKIGVTFQFIGYNNHFSIIFKNIEIEKYLWYVTNSEIIYYDENLKKACEGVLKPNKYSGQLFAKKINECAYHVIHARILATSTNKTIDPDEIADYETFCSSDCEFALLCADCYVDFYAKDEKIIDAIAEACKQNYTCEISFITKENDERTGFYI